ncbi:Lrp/AsnC family transcriptional regulator [Christiangramia sp.]|uniref:Lrp/AsnC family transcriptional regulator n=1 Tax=Christiangramia sp. TaxID=1931228 RepID=UPI002620E517|nr:Lrp/AsnC family transcriptional regulator [Christiangramia sp.]
MVDAIDLKIISRLQLNSRASFVEIGKQIGLSPSSVRERVQKLEETNVIKAYKAQLDYNKLGYGLEVMIMLKMFSGKLKDFNKQVHDFPEIKELYRITGPHNIFMKVVLKDQSHLQQFIDRLLAYGEPTTHLILSDFHDFKSSII